MSKHRAVVAVIDDDRSVLRAIKSLLSALDYAAELYDSAEAFLMAATESTATCLLIDVQLGATSGIELGSQLVAKGFMSPMIFMTASDNELHEKDAMKVGCVAYLRKPFSRDQLLEALAGSKI